MFLGQLFSTMEWNRLLSVLQHLEAFEAENAHGSIHDFANWLAIKTRPETKQAEARTSVEGSIAEGVGKLYFYARHYFKKGFADGPLNTIQEFTFLATLAQTGKMTKTQLIHENLVEVPSGIEVIKRLIKAGFIHEEENLQDKRSKLLSVTPEGMAATIKAFGQIEPIAQLVSGPLSEEEKIELNRLIHKLDCFHKKMWDENNKASLTELMKEVYN